MRIKRLRSKKNTYCPNERIFRSFFLGLYSVNKNKTFLNCNNTFAKLLGLKSNQSITGKSFASFRYKKLLKFFTSNDNFVFQHGIINEVNRVFTQINSRPFIRLVKFPIKNEQGTVIGVNGIILNIPFSINEYPKLLKKIQLLQNGNEILKTKLNLQKDEIRELKKSKNYLNNILDNIPGFIYWKDRRGIILGDNKLHAKAIGLSSVEEVIGKTDYDFAWHDQANEMRKNDLAVMRNGKTVIVEEEGVLPNGGKIVGLTHKAPLRDEDKKVIGVIGISLDITDRKKAEQEAERLRLETELQKIKLAEQESFRKVVDQVVHDIRSPLASLLMIIKSCENEIPEQTRIALREAATGIGDIANNLLDKYKKEDFKISTTEERQPLMVALVLFQILSEKKHQYKESLIKFIHNFCPECNFVFIRAEFTSFKRMLSNLINNAVDALDSREGVIELKLGITDKKLKITILDDGKGMSREVIDKIMNKIAVTSGKNDGHGIGFTQIMGTLERNEGKLDIKSKLGEGTEMILTFPIIDSPDWVAKEIKLNKGDTVLVLDDDASIHHAWEARFKNCSDITLKHFTLGEEAISFINSLHKKECLFLLADFELLKQELNGLNVIERTKIKRSILVTSHYNNLVVRNLAIKSGTRILPKQLASEIPIQIGDISIENKHTIECDTNKNASGGGKNCKNNQIGKNPKKDAVSGKPKKVDVVLLDDEEMLLDALASLVESKGKVVDKYYKPTKFLEKLDQYPKGTKIFMDNDFKSSIDGLELAKQLHEKGYTNLYLFSGKDFAKGEIPDYLIVISKTDTDKLMRFVG